MSKMWQLSVLSALILISSCPVQSQVPEDQGCGWYEPKYLQIDRRLDPKDSIAYANELPWMAMVERRMPSEESNGSNDWRVRVYDGVLINPQAVLVSRSSVEGAKRLDLTVRVGAWDGSGNVAKSNFQSEIISEIIYNDDPDEEGLQSLFAILILSAPFQLGENVRPMCLPLNDDEWGRSQCIVSGWSGNVTDPDKNQLQRVGVPIIPRDDCTDIYSNYHKSDGPLVPLWGKTICAGSKEEPSMNESERGRALFCPFLNEPSRYVLVGFDISSFGGKPDDVYLPAQFTRVSADFNWINNKLSDTSG